MLEKVRGCGTRKEGLYLCAQQSPDGKPIEFFLIDPPIHWGGRQLRSPLLYEDKKEKVYHVILGVGKEYYPFVPDYIEECRHMGISKRLPLNFPVEKLSHKSCLILIHPRAIPNFNYEVKDHSFQFFGPDGYRLCICKKHLSKNDKCIYDLYSLSTLQSDEKHVVKVNDNIAEIVTGSYEVVEGIKHYVAYRTKVAIKPKTSGPYKQGMFLKIPHLFYEYVSKKKRVPERLAKRILDGELEMKICEG